MKKRSLLLASATGVALFASPVFAEETASVAAEAPAQAQDQEYNRGDVIIVTARRRQETAQAVPLAISVVKADSIESTGNFNVAKLPQLAPTLQVYTSNPRNTSVNIRGLGVPFGLTSDGFEQGVGIYVDDVYNSRVAAATFDFLDVEQVEVLRGPQGTLYGKNTTAGAINITTNQPTFDFEGRAELTLGNFSYRQAKAAVSGPITDTIAARFALASTTRRGTLYNVASNRWINEQDNLGFRGQLLFKPNDDFSVTLSGDYSTQDPYGFGTAFYRVGLTQRALNRQYEALVAAINAANPGRNYAVPSRNIYDRVTDIDASLQAGNKIGGASLKAKWDIGAGTLTSITAWRFWDWKPQNDRDFTGLSIVSKSQNPSQQNQYSQEFRYNYDGEKVDFVLGLFGFKQRIDTQGTEQQGSDASRWSLKIAPDVMAYPGEHDGIISQEVWDKVHAILKISPRTRANKTRAKTPAFLKGLLWGPDGAAFSPTHTRKGGKLYRYYVSQSVLRHGAGVCPVGGVPAAEIESAVIEQLRAIFRQPEILAGSTKAARGHLPVITEEEARMALTTLAPMWDELFPAEQTRIVQMLVERVDIGTEGFDVQLRLDGMATFAQEMREAA